MDEVKSEGEGARQEVMPDDEEDDDDGDGDAGVQAPATGVCTPQILCEFAAIRFDVGLIVHMLSASELFLSLGIGHEAVELVLTFGGIDMDAAEATGLTSSEEGHEGGLS